MKKTFFGIAVSLLTISSLILASCDVQTTIVDNVSSYTPLRVSSANCNYGGEIKSVAAVDEYTVKFTLCKPDASFPAKIASPIFAVQDQDFLNKNEGISKNLTKNVNGTGPYKLMTDNLVGQIQLHTSENYWGMVGGTQTLKFNFMSNSKNGPTAAELNQTDVVSSAFSNQTLSSLLDNESAFQAKAHPALNLVYLGFSNKVAPMDNVSVRQAFAVLLDTQSLVNDAFPQGTKTASQMVSADSPTGYDAQQTWYGVNVNAAQDLLNKAGFDYNQTITLAFVEDASDLIASPAALATAIQRQFAAIHIKVTLKPLNQSEFDQATANGAEMMFLDSFTALYPDGAAFYEYPFVRQASHFGNRYSDLVNGLGNVQSKMEASTRQEAFRALNQSFKTLIPLIPIANVTQWSFFGEDVKNAAVNGYFESYELLTNGNTSLNILESNRPLSLWPADETDADTFRLTRMLYDTLVAYSFDSNELKSDLADSWKSNTDGTQWTFTLRYNVHYTNGSLLDANDVVASFAAIWNSADANHHGRTGDFTYFRNLFGSLLNQ
jgi:ABC-type transport system substrate-binding protein